MPPTPLRLTGLALLAAATLSCIEGDTMAQPTGTADIVVLAQDIDFDHDTYTLPAGTNTIDYLLDGSLPHTLLIEDQTGTVLDFNLEVGDRAGGLDTATITLKPGTYTFFCDIPGHRSAGMEAGLVVTASPGR